MFLNSVCCILCLWGLCLFVLSDLLYLPEIRSESFSEVILLTVDGIRDSTFKFVLLVICLKIFPICPLFELLGNY